MFYYGLDFHDLAPDSFLHVSAFVIMCEAFLRIPPHFVLWLKTFNVKPKVVDGKQAECSGAAVNQTHQYSLAKRLLHRNFQPMAAGVVLHH